MGLYANHTGLEVDVHGPQLADLAVLPVRTDSGEETEREKINQNARLPMDT